LSKGTGYKTRTIEERVSDIHYAFSQAKFDAIIAIRGGYGSAQLLNYLDYKLIRKNPKVFIGYSDITALHLAINQNSDLVTFHGPLLMSAFSDFTAGYFEKALFSSEPIGIIQNPSSKSGIRDLYPTRTIVSGSAKGKLTGGNLSLISSLMGTPYEIETKNKILFIEDVQEPPYKIDRMMTQLLLSGKLNDAAGIVFGLCNDCLPSGTFSTWDHSLGEVLDGVLLKAGVPAFYGLLFGHTRDQATIPYSIEAEMNADEGWINITENGVI